MARLYADENFDYPIVEELRRLGHVVLTAQEAGQGGQEIPYPPCSPIRRRSAAPFGFARHSA